MNLTIDHGSQVELPGLARAARVLTVGATLEGAARVADLDHVGSPVGAEFDFGGSGWRVAACTANGDTITFTARRING